MPTQGSFNFQLAETKKAVKVQGSNLVNVDVSGCACVRCGHACKGRHHPGLSGRCASPGCNCLWAVVYCSCPHKSYDHEPWGQERGTHCQRCECPAFCPRTVAS